MVSNYNDLFSVNVNLELITLKHEPRLHHSYTETGKLPGISTTLNIDMYSRASKSRTLLKRISIQLL